MLARLRLAELTLLVCAAAAVGAGYLLILLVRSGTATWTGLAPVLLLASLAGITYLYLAGSGFRGDQALLPIAVFLTGLGLVLAVRLIYTAPFEGVDLVQRQTAWTAIGFLALWATLALTRDLSWLARYKYTWALLGMVVVAATFLFGSSSAPGGPRLWINFGLFQFQPAEGMKVLLVLFLAGYLSEFQEVLAWGHYRIFGLALPPVPHLVPLGIMWGLALVLAVVQRDLGLAIMLFGVCIAMLYIASGRAFYILAGVLAVPALAYVAYHAIAIVRERFQVWLDPWATATTQGYQLVQSVFAFAAGGVIGTGPGYGYPGYVPAVYTDLVLAAFGEELGLAGTLVVVMAFMCLVYEGYRIALRAPDSFRRMLAAGLTTTLGLQALIIMGGSLRLVPLTGVTLPFLSYGGSSLVTNFVIIGLLLRIAEPRPARMPDARGLHKAS